MPDIFGVFAWRVVAHVEKAAKKEAGTAAGKALRNALESFGAKMGGTVAHPRLHVMGSSSFHTNMDLLPPHHPGFHPGLSGTRRAAPTSSQRNPERGARGDGNARVEPPHRRVEQVFQQDIVRGGRVRMRGGTGEG